MTVVTLPKNLVTIPKYDELPVIEAMDLPHAWGVFGENDQLGSINHLTPERVVAAAGLVRTGRVHNVVVPIDGINPPLYGRAPVEHEIFEISRNSRDDKLDSFYLQSSSQWDGLRHVRAREFGFWGGITDESEFKPGSGPLGIEHWVNHGMVGRGVLLDIARHFEGDGYDPMVKRSIEPDDLEAIAEAQGVELREGDILCLRTGWMGAYFALEGEERTRKGDSKEFVGLGAGEDMARWLWDHHVAAVAADNPAVEVSPGDPQVGSFHRRMIPLLGLALGELFQFDSLAEQCAEDGIYEFLFVGIPLNVTGGVGSPANSIAIK